MKNLQRVRTIQSDVFDFVDLGKRPLSDPANQLVVLRCNGTCLWFFFSLQVRSIHRTNQNSLVVKSFLANLTNGMLGLAAVLEPFCYFRIVTKTLCFFVNLWRRSQNGH